MASSGERILIVESDPDISDLIARQALKPLGYNVTVVGEAAAAIKQAVQTPPGPIIANLNLPGLSGKDLLAAMTSQGIKEPLIILAEKGQEQNVIQAFRLGAVDAVFWPARDVEIVRVVERSLQQTRETRARVQLDQQLQSTNQELQRKLRELTTILSIGGESLTINGAPLEKFKVAALGKSAAVIPLKVQGEVIGLLLVVRKADREIDRSAQSLLEAVADFAAISLVNSHLFRTVEQIPEAARMNEKTRNAMLETLRESIREEMQVSMYPLEALISGAPGPLTGAQEQALKSVQNSLQRLSRAAEKTLPPYAGKVK